MPASYTTGNILSVLPLGSFPLTSIIHQTPGNLSTLPGSCSSGIAFSLQQLGVMGRDLSWAKGNSFWRTGHQNAQKLEGLATGTKRFLDPSLKNEIKWAKMPPAFHEIDHPQESGNFPCKEEPQKPTGRVSNFLMSALRSSESRSGRQLLPELWEPWNFSSIPDNGPGTREQSELRACAAARSCPQHGEIRMC